MIRPKSILSDNGPQFRSKVWNTFIEEQQIRHITTSTYRPASNGAAERTMRELGRLFKAYCGHKHKSWITKLSNFENVMNSLVHSSTGLPPCTVLFGKEPEKIYLKRLFSFHSKMK